MLKVKIDGWGQSNFKAFGDFELSTGPFRRRRQPQDNPSTFEQLLEDRRSGL
jgi:hypothetical protein